MRPPATEGRAAGSTATPAPGAPAVTRRRPRPAAAVVAAGRCGFAASQATPLVIDGVMYLSTPYSRVVALDPSSGKEIWAYRLPTGNPSTRGVEYWAGDGKTPAQIVFGTSDAKLYSLDAKTGKPNEAFGDKGVVNLEHARDPARAARDATASARRPWFTRTS